MAKYYLHITVKDLYEDSIGTGFLGVPITNEEELKEAVMEYGSYKRYCSYTEKVEQYWHELIRITISSGDIVDEFKEAINRCCCDEEIGHMDLFSLSSELCNDPLSKYEIYYRPKGWVDEMGKFKFVLYVDGEDHHIYDMKLSELLRSIGVEI